MSLGGGKLKRSPHSDEASHFPEPQLKFFGKTFIHSAISAISRITMSFKLGPITYPKALFMAPMEGITDIPFRKIVREHGCAVTCTQMIHADGLLKGNQSRMAEVTAMTDEEKPVGFQLCGESADLVAQAGQKAQSMGASFIDLNLGCPAKNVVKRGAGAALLQDPKKASNIISALVNAISIPVTIKIRAGWDNDYLGGFDVAKMAQDAGVKLITVHARTRNQKYKGHANWDLIKKLKSELTIPVIGNGDVFEPSDILDMQNQTGADGVMVARGALGNPWIFENKHPTIGDIEKTLLRHLDYHMDFYKGSFGGLVTFRKHIAWYTKGIPDSAEFRVQTFKEKELFKVKEMLKIFFDAQDPNQLAQREYPAN